MAERERLDAALVARGLAENGSKARGLIMAAEVTVNGRMVDKPGTRVSEDAVIEVAERKRWVGRGGLKLDAALQTFEVDPAGRVCADVGACTGGFTDVLLQGGASKVYAIDVGYGQLDWTLRNDERVVVMERTNARYVESLPEVVDLVVIDVSFISLRIILAAVLRWLAPDSTVIALIKPQFEAGRDDVGGKGIVRDPAVHRQVVRDVLTWAVEHGFTARGLTVSPIHGAGGNVEFLARLDVGASDGPIVDIEKAVMEIAPDE